MEILIKVHKVQEAVRCKKRSSVTVLEKLHGALMFFSGAASAKRSQIAAFSRFGIGLSRVQAETAG